MNRRQFVIGSGAAVVAAHLPEQTVFNGEVIYTDRTIYLDDGHHYFGCEIVFTKPVSPMVVSGYGGSMTGCHLRYAV